MGVTEAQEGKASKGVDGKRVKKEELSSGDLNPCKKLAGKPHAALGLQARGPL